MNAVDLPGERMIDMRTLEDNSFLFLIVAVSLAFVWILLPIYGGILWAAVTAILFAPMHRRLLKSMQQRRNLAAFSSVMIIVGIVIVPTALIAASLTQEALGFYRRIESGELDLVRSFQQVHDVLPVWATNLLARLGLASLGATHEKLVAGLWPEHVRLRREPVRHAVLAVLPAT